MERLKGVRAGQQKPPEPPHIPVVTLTPGKRCTIRRGRIDHRPGQKLHGIRALYVRYLYILGVIGPRGQRRRPVPFNVRAEVKKLEKYKRQFTMKRCAICGKAFLPGSNRVKYCDDCKVIALRQQKAEYAKRYRANSRTIEQRSP